MKLNLVNICLSFFLLFLIVFFLLLPHFRKSKIEALNGDENLEKGGITFPNPQKEYLWNVPVIYPKSQKVGWILAY